MKLLFATTLLTASPAAAAWAQAGQGPPGPWQPWHMHDWGMGWGGGMFLGPLLTIAFLALLIAAVFALVRWLGAGDGGASRRTARDILDERYARGEIDREQYEVMRQDLSK
jgi:putative membrane protein